MAARYRDERRASPGGETCWSGSIAERAGRPRDSNPCEAARSGTDTGSTACTAAKLAAMKRADGEADSTSRLDAVSASTGESVSIFFAAPSSDSAATARVDAPADSL